MSVLKSCSWSKPVLRLIEATKELDPTKPAILHIRHTARTTITRDEIEGAHEVKVGNLLLTPEGIQAAIEFGASLPKDRDYTIYHTIVPRAQETAEGITRGIIDSGGRAKIGGAISFRVCKDPDAWDRWLAQQKWYPQDGAYDCIRMWTAGLIPNTIYKPSLDFALGYARESMENLHRASSDALHIYVSHDNYVGTLIYHWFGVPFYTDGIRYLEGFLMQVDEKNLKAWLRDRREVYPYPYWWPK